jgi:hypothetical protein
VLTLWLTREDDLKEIIRGLLKNQIEENLLNRLYRAIIPLPIQPQIRGLEAPATLAPGT